ASVAGFAQNPNGVRVTEGDFFCFPGMDSSQFNIVEKPASRLHKAMRVDKLGNSRWDNADGHDIREVPTQGDYKVLVILVDFADNHFSVNNGEPYTLVNEMLNGENYSYNGATGSANAFFRTISNGQFNPQFNLYGPVQLDHNEDYYVRPNDGTRPNYPRQYYTDPTSGKEVEVYYPGLMVKEAIEKLNDRINFADYDSNGDGLVDFVYFFHAGKGATTGGDPKKVIWPHAFTLNAALGTTVALDGVEINRYATSAELGRNNRLSGIGTFCHEFSHVLGLPDLYDTASNGTVSKCFTPGTFDCMDGGNYNNNEHTPPLFSGYERYALEWMLPVTLTGSADITLLPLSARNFAYKVPTSKPQEYFILEARAPYGYDKFIEGHGMAAWHIDFNLDIWNRNTPNNNANHQRIDLVEADGALDTSSRDGDLFPGAQTICEFQSNISPTFVDWSNKPTGFEISNIVRNIDGSVSFRLEATSGKKMTGAEIGTPLPFIREASDNGFLLDWEPVNGAKGYMVSVYKNSDCNGATIADFAEGYYFKDIEDATSIQIEGLEPGVEYSAIVYAYNDFNASRSELPVNVATLESEFSKAAPNLYLYADNGVADIRWDAV
ncbi:MAG: M6 family metalloprotease domain-containing protein, partial [Muribaculaceae bacterium]|nr:M6 family metalloprotease domain-containing protein [Muribaculaceae bacterium]